MKSLPDRPTTISALRSCGILAPLPAEHLDMLAAESRSTYVERGEEISLGCDSVPFFGVVSTGFVKMVREMPGGQEFTCEIMGPGQTFGLLCMLGGCSCSLRARAVCGAWLVRIPKASFMPMYQTSETLKSDVMVRTSARLREAYDMLARMASGGADERIAAVLLILTNSYGTKTDAGIRIDVPLSRQDIAEMAGITIESTIRTLSRWTKQGILRSERKHIVVCDEDAIAAVLER